jgi:hypothetical protein
LKFWNKIIHKNIYIFEYSTCPFCFQLFSNFNWIQSNKFLIYLEKMLFFCFYFCFWNENWIFFFFVSFVYFFVFICILICLLFCFVLFGIDVDCDMQLHVNAAWDFEIYWYRSKFISNIAIGL